MQEETETIKRIYENTTHEDRKFGQVLQSERHRAARWKSEAAGHGIC